ncbi:MAG TPA: 2-oxo acid dehydrogenase subunit E2 [Anaerolineales bacterium]
MATPVKMPKVDMDQETGTVVEWHKQEGEPVKQGESILTIETDKVAIEVESPATGILQNITAHPGDVIPIATVIATILEPGEALPTAGPAQMPPAPSRLPADGPVPAQPRVNATPVARNMAAAAGLDLSALAGSGPRGQVTKLDVQSALTTEPAAGLVAGKPYATPAARRAARNEGVDLTSVTGSGPQGRIQAADVWTAAEAMAAVAAPQAGEAALGVAFEEGPKPQVEIIPLQGMRRTIAERMTHSYQSTPHITFTVRVDMTRFDQARAELNEHARLVKGAHISATAMIVKAVAQVLEKHPMLNSSLRGEEIRVRRDVNIGVAVALEEGLIVPVVHNCNQKGIAQIAAEVDDLAERARLGHLIPSDVSDGTFTISNLGPFGIEQFTAIINPPQAAILAVGAAQPEVVPGEGGQIVIHSILHMTLSADHRVVDGAVAARFISDLKAVLEKPVLLLW